MGRVLFLLFTALWLAGCAAGEPPGPYDPVRFRDAPERYALVGLAVTPEGLADWALILRRLDGTAEGAEIRLTPDAGHGTAGRPVAINRALPAGRYRAVRIMAVQDGRPCGTAPEAEVTRAIYSAALPEKTPVLTLAGGERVHLGRVAISAVLFACERPPRLTVSQSPGEANGVARHAALLPADTLTLTAR